MTAQKETRHMLIDLKTGYTYGVVLDDKGLCRAFQQFNTAVQTLDEGRVVGKFGPTAGINEGKDATVPYGMTIYATELGSTAKDKKIFTIAFPSKKELDAGVLPVVAQKTLPQDLARAGFAAAASVRNKDAEADNALELAQKNINMMIGLEGAKRDIQQNIAIAQFNKLKTEMGLETKPISRHMVFTGSPGTGKTTFAREVAKVYHALGLIKKPTVVEVMREDLVAGYVGQTAIKTKEVIEKAAGGILFIDEAYSLARGAAAGGKADFGAEAIDTLVAAMENMRDDLVVIVAGYPEPMKRFIEANEGLKSRFMNYISFEDYNAQELGQILDTMSQELGYSFTPEARAVALEQIESERVADQKNFANARVVRNLVQKAEKELALRLANEDVFADAAALDRDVLIKRLTTVTAEDVRKVALGGIEKAPAGGSPGFDFSKVARNDNDEVTLRPPRPAVEEGEELAARSRRRAGKTQVYNRK